MGTVFANGNEISAKKDDNKAIAAMPDVCLSPPSPPAGPIPIPYPNSSETGKTTDGSKTVKIGGQEVGLKNVSTWKDSNGDEAATKSFGMNVVSHNISGPLKHAAWSMDVKIEGYNAIRHMDMTTQNHSNPPGVPGIDLGKMPPPSGDPECVELENDARAAQADTGGSVPGDTAVVTAKHSSGTKLKACAPGDAVASGKQSGWCSGPPASKSNVACSSKPYNPNTQGNRDHAESKVIESLFAGGASPGGTLTMRINWNTGGEHAQRPCSQCMGTICETMQACGIQIKICVSNFDGSMESKPAPCKTVNHKNGTKSHKWETSRMFK